MKCGNGWKMKDVKKQHLSYRWSEIAQQDVIQGQTILDALTLCHLINISKTTPM